MAEREKQPVPRDNAELARRLETALHEELGRGHVDVAELVRGTRRRNGRERWRRTAVLAAAAVAVAAVPIGIAVAQQDGPAAGQQASVLPPTGTPRPTGTDSPAPTPSATPSETAAAPETSTPPETATETPTETPSRSPVAVPSPVQRYGVPASVGPSLREVGSGMELLDDMEYLKGPTLMGQYCPGDIPESQLPAARRNWMYSPGGMDSVDVVVTGWKDSRTAYRELVEDSAPCRLAPLMDWEARASDENSWSAVGESNGLQYGFAARRLEGDVIVTVTVIMDGEAVAIKEARRILDVTVDRAFRAGIAAPTR